MESLLFAIAVYLVFQIFIMTCMLASLHEKVKSLKEESKRRSREGN